MKQSKEPSLLVKTVRCNVSKNNCRHPFWYRFNVSIICTLCTNVPETDKLFVGLGHMLEYHLATLTGKQAIQSFIQAPSTRIRVLMNPQHLYPGSKIPTSTRIHQFQIEFARPHVSGFTLVPRPPLGILVTEHAS